MAHRWRSNLAVRVLSFAAFCVLFGALFRVGVALADITNDAAAAMQAKTSVAVGASQPADAAGPAAIRVKAAALIREVTRGQEHLVSTFRGPGNLLGAVVASQSGQRDVAWLASDASAVMVGSLIGPHGEDLTRAAKVRLGIIASPADVLREASEPTSRGILMGSAGPVLTVFFDPNCAYCHELFGALHAAIANGKARVRFVMVGTLKATSVRRAASILAAKDPAAALTENETHLDLADEEGGLPIAPNVDPQLVDAIQRNNRLYTRGGMVGTPTILYCNDNGRAVMASGVPRNVTALLASVGTCR